MCLCVTRNMLLLPKCLMTRNMLLFLECLMTRNMSLLPKCLTQFKPVLSLTRQRRHLQNKTKGRGVESSENSCLLINDAVGC